MLAQPKKEILSYMGQRQCENLKLVNLPKRTENDCKAIPRSVPGFCSEQAAHP